MTTEEQVRQQELEELAEYSPVAKQFVSNNLFEHCKLITLSSYVGGDEINNLYGLSFHPDGNCGCIELPDAYMFGIRCDHLMWSDGWCEGDDGSTILIYGNHKGEFVMKLIYLDISLDEDEDEDED